MKIHEISNLDMNYSNLVNAPIATNFKNCTAYVGVDINRKSSLVSLLFLIEKEDILYALPRFFYPTNSNTTHFQKWIKQGYVNKRRSKIVYVNSIVDTIENISKYLNIKCICVDKYVACPFKKLNQHRINDPIILLSNNLDVDNAIHQFYGDVFNNKLVIHDNPVMRWCNNNVKIIEKENKRLTIISRVNRGNVGGYMALLQAYTGYIDYNNIGKVEFDIEMLLRKEKIKKLKEKIKLSSQ